MLKLHGRQTAHIRCQVRLGTNQFAKLHELIGAKFVRLITVVGRRFVAVGAVPEIRTPRPLVSRTDSVAPIVAVGEAAARVAHHGRFNLFHMLDHVATQPVHIRHFGLGSDPQPVVNHAAQVLREMTIDVGRDDSLRFVKQNVDARIGRRRRLLGQRRETGHAGCGRTCQGAFYKLATAFHGIPPVRVNEHGSRPALCQTIRVGLFFRLHTGSDIRHESQQLSSKNDLSNLSCLPNFACLLELQ
jgi:hypothetical protein